MIEETVYGVTPGAGDFTEVRMTSEDLSGTPQVVESAEIRSDRQTSGQTKTGLELSGGYNFELTDDPSLALGIKLTMQSDQVAQLNITGQDLTIGAVTNGSATLTRAAGSFLADGFVNGDVVVLGGYAAAENNVPVLLSNVAGLTCTITGKGIVAEAGGGDESITRPPYHEIGTSAKSASISKEFLDLGSRNVAYTGMRASEMALNFAFGSIVTGRFSFAGNGYDTPALPITNGRTINAATSSPALDASNGFGWLLVDGADIGVCIEAIDLTLNNNLIAQNCIGELAPKDQVLGSAAVAFNGTFHLGANSFDTFMAAKVAQTPLSIAFHTVDENGQGYAITLERVQVNFPDPGSGGRDQTVTFAASGVASLDAVVGRTMRIYII